MTAAGTSTSAKLGILFAALFGVAMGSEVDVVAYLTSRYFGLLQYGLVFGILLSVYGFAVGVSAWIVGKVFDLTGSYDSALVALMVGVGVALALILSLGRPPVLETPELSASKV